MVRVKSRSPKLWILTFLLVLVIFILYTIFFKHQRIEINYQTDSESAPKSRSGVGFNGSVVVLPSQVLPESDIKLIYMATRSFKHFEQLDFSKCEYHNCVSEKNIAGIYPTDADIMIFEYHRFFFTKPPRMPWRDRSRQIWILYSQESYSSWNWRLNGKFNATMTFRRDSDLVLPYAKAEKLTHKTSKARNTNYATGKTKGAYAYVSNCHAENYDRLNAMRELRKYIDVDIFGYCTGSKPCAHRFDTVCESKAHAAYRFFLSFENALFRDYITEKFWSRLAASGHFIPVAMGGASLSDYTRVAPADSFLHVYNFTDMAELGKYLQNLTTNDLAYNRYHEWRDRYRIVNSPVNDVACPLCELANEKPYLPAKENLTDWWKEGLTGDLQERIT